MTNTPTIREVPSPLLVAPPADSADESYPGVPGEPILATDQIQGNILAGFNKDHQTLVFLKITDAVACKAWLKTLIPFIATVEEVLAFNRLFKSIRTRRHGECRTVQATWINIAFSYTGLQQLVPTDVAFTDRAFLDGLAKRSSDLGDPTDPTSEGNPTNWVVGGPDNEADIVLLFAADDRTDLLAEVARIEDSLYAARTSTGGRTRSGVHVLYKQHGATLPHPLIGHEHFGFLDGISQPGIRGRLSANEHDVLTPRQNANNRDQGKPGQDLLWPGEFVFGYPGQNGAGKVTDQGQVAQVGPSWTENGSFLVFRRLRQDVLGFRNFLETAATTQGVTAETLGAKMVGRWTSGAPILRAEQADNPLLGTDDCANNNFEFQGPTSPLPATSAGTLDCRDSVPGANTPAMFSPSPGDTTGVICPIGAHIRKAYPRDDVPLNQSPYPTPGAVPLNESDTQTHRLLRRGLPFGDPALPVQSGDQPDPGDRGLLFLAYQTSIERQFEFVTKQWVNNPNFKDAGTGFDPILGQNGQTGNRDRQFSFVAPDGTVKTVDLPADWVIPTGGGYFFAPSIHALEDIITN